ncbi:AAA family ATPase [Candidatus Peregrinibacteria bacterium]|nr:AAA family ATPase [Candidatus Peregrinibacteria bacterium]
MIKKTKNHRHRLYSVMDELNGNFVSEDKQYNDKVFFNVSDFTDPEDGVYHVKVEGFNLEDISLSPAVRAEVQDIIFEHENRDFFVKRGIIPFNKLLLYGPPGCGKTMLAYSIGKVMKRSVEVVNLGKLVSSNLGETSKNIADLFSKYGNEKHVLVIDEFDIIGRLRGDKNNDHNEMKRVVNTLLQSIDFFPSNGFLIFATNDFSLIDDALVRRMDLTLNIGLPNQKQIRNFLKSKIIKHLEFVSDEIDYETLSKKFLGQSYSFIQSIFNKVIRRALIDSKRNDVFFKKMIISNKNFKYFLDSF